MGKGKLSNALKIAIYTAMAILLVSGIAIPLAGRDTAPPEPPASAPAQNVHVSVVPPGGEGPIEIVSVTGPLAPINPGGPRVRILVRNASDRSVMTLTAVLRLGSDFEFSFEGVTPSRLLRPGQETSAERVLIGAGFSDNVTYPITISGSLENEATFSYTKQVLISAPAN